MRHLSSVLRVVLYNRTKWSYNNFVFYTYILQLANGLYYHGYSDNLKQRLKEHQNGIVPSTKSFRPISLVFYAAFSTKTKALAFERYLKSGSGFAFRNKHLI